MENYQQLPSPSAETDRDAPDNTGEVNNDPTNKGRQPSQTKFTTNCNLDSTCNEKIASSHSLQIPITQESNGDGLPNDPSDLDAEAGPFEHDYDLCAELDPGRVPEQEGNLYTPAAAEHLNFVLKTRPIEHALRLVPDVPPSDSINNQTSLDETDEDDLFGPDPDPEKPDFFEHQSEFRNEKDRDGIEELSESDTETKDATRAEGDQITRQAGSCRSPDVAGSLSGESPRKTSDDSTRPLEQHSHNNQPLSPPNSDAEENSASPSTSEPAQSLSSSRNRLPSPPLLKESSAEPHESRASRQASPADYEGPPLDLDQLPIDQLNQLQMAARAKIMTDTYKSGMEMANDLNLPDALDYLTRLNPESQILWLSQQPSTVKQRSTQAVNGFKEDAESRKAPNFEADLKRLARLDPAGQLAYLQWPGPQPVARKALKSFEIDIKQKGWPLDRFKDLYLMNSQEQVNYLYERMEFWPGFAKQYGLTPRPSNSDPKWEGRWPEPTEIVSESKERSPALTSVPRMSLNVKYDTRSNPAYLSAPVQSPVSRPHSPKKDIADIPHLTPTEMNVGFLTTQVGSISEELSDPGISSTPPIPSHLFTSSESALATWAPHTLEAVDQKDKQSQGRSKTPTPPQAVQDDVRQSLESLPFTSVRPRDSSPPYEDRSAAPSPQTDADTSMEDAPPVPSVDPVRIRPDQIEAKSGVPSSPDIITTSATTVPSPSKIHSHLGCNRSLSQSYSTADGVASSTPRLQSKSSSRSPVKTLTTPKSGKASGVQPPYDGTPIIPKKSDRRKSFSVIGFKVEKLRKATQGNSNSVKDAVEKIEACLEKEKEKTSKRDQRDVTPRRSERIRRRRETESMSPSPGCQVQHCA